MTSTTAKKKKVFPSAKRAIAITGINGFIGTYLFQRLQQNKDYRLIALDIKRPSTLDKHTKFYKVDLTIPTIDASIAEILERENCDTFVHLAFLTNPIHNYSYAHELEAIGTMNILHACAKVNIRKIVVGSTTMVYGARPTNPNFLSEDTPLEANQRYRYIRDKVEVERLIRKYRSRRPDTIITVLRPCTILGPTIKNYVTNYLRRPFVLTLLGYDPLYQLVHEDDVLEAFALVIDKDFSGEYNIVGKGVLPLSTLIKLSGKVNFPVLHSVAYPLVDALWMAQVSNFPGPHLDYIRYIYVADCEKAKADIGFEAKYTTKEALESFLGIQRLRQIHLVE